MGKIQSNLFRIDTISSESTTNNTDSELIPQICNVVYRILTKKHDLSVEEMEKALEIKITPREQKELQKMSWEDMISKAMKFNPNSKPKKKGKK